MKKKRGFTLIELLAVIVILAIIAIIAIPIILNMIEQAKKAAARDTAYGYIEAINYHMGFVDVGLDGYENIPDNTEEKEFYTVEEISEYGVKHKGKSPDDGVIKIKNKRVTQASLCIGKYKVDYNGKEVTKIETSNNCNGEEDEEEIPFDEPEGEYVRELCGGTTYNSGTLYKIKKVEDMVCLSKKVNDGTTFEGAQIQLVANVDFNKKADYVDSNTTLYGDINEDETTESLYKELTTKKGFKPIGNNTNKFKGNFFGNNFSLVNIKVNRPEESYIGIFGYIDRTTEISKLTVKKANITGYDNVGGLVGFTNNGNSSKKVKVITVKDSIINGNQNVGGIIGTAQLGNAQTLQALNVEVNGNKNVGGVVGNAGGSVIEMIFDTKVTGTENVGGVAGYVSSNVHNGVGKSVVSGTTKVGGAVGSQSASNQYSYVKGFILEGGSSTGSTIHGYGNNYYSNSFYLDGYEAANVQGGYYNSDSKTLNSYENAIDTIIGGDNDGTGYYFKFDNNNKIQLVSVEDYPINFTLSGTGTQADPFLISSVKEWNEAATKVQLSNTYYKLTADLDFTGKEFLKMGSLQNQYVGNFDGNNHTIKGVNITGGSYQGAFGYIARNGSVKNLTIMNSKIEKAIDNNGLFTGYADNNSKISNIIVKNSEIEGRNNIGGVIGNNSSVARTLQSVNVEVSGNKNLGGIVGANGGTVTEMIFDTKVTGTENVGGAAGYTSSNVHNGVGKSVVSGTTKVGGAVGSQSSSNQYSYVKGFILEGGSSTGSTIHGYGNNYYSNSFYLDGYEAANVQGMSLTADAKTLNSYENAIDTIIGGDNDGSGYYFKFDNNNKIQLVSVEDNPINFTLSGEGTESDPYLISNTTEWNEATTKAQLTGKYYKLTADLDFTGKEFLKMGSLQNQFGGNFDGNNHTIKGVTITGGSYEGIFGYSGRYSSIKDLTIINSEIKKGTDNCGILAGYLANLTASNITVKNSKVNGRNNIGGVVGGSSSANMYAVQSLNVEVNGNKNVGGVIGSSGGTVSEIKFDTKVNGTENVGGVAGYVSSTTQKGIGKSVVSGTTRVGGAVGSQSASNQYSYVKKFILEGGSSSGSTIHGYGNSYQSGCAYIDGYTSTNTQATKWNTEFLHDLTKYGEIVDTSITGDTDSSGYYFDYNNDHSDIIIKKAD